MQGIDAAKQWFFSAGLPMLERDFADVLPRIAAGLAGRGSECFGFDDEISQDHDFFTGFALWITDEDEKQIGFRLERAYTRLMKEHPPELSASAESMLGGPEHGVCTISGFYQRHLGFPGAPRNWREWLYTPEYAFAEAVNGAVFRDDAGIFSGIRNTILNGMPVDVLLKKLAARAVFMAQSGQYNFARCLKHGERGAAVMALTEFVRQAASMIFLLNRRFMPYYKWMFRAMRDLPIMNDMAEPLEFLLTEHAESELKITIVDHICNAVTDELSARGLVEKKKDVYLEPYAFELMAQIRDPEIRSLHIMEG